MQPITQNKACLKHVLKIDHITDQLLQHAQESILVAMDYHCTDLTLCNILNTCILRGIIVRILTVKPTLTNPNASNCPFEFAQSKGQIYLLDAQTAAQYLPCQNFWIIDHKTLVLPTDCAQQYYAEPNQSTVISTENAVIVYNNDHLATKFSFAFETAYTKAQADSNQPNTLQNSTKYPNLTTEWLKIHLNIIYLEAEIIRLKYEQADIEKKIRAFDARHERDLGHLIREILKIKIKIAHQKAAKNPKNKSRQYRYAETRKDYTQFDKHYDTSHEKNVLPLAGNQQKVLKDKFRRATKLCYPDLVSPECKDDAQRVFVQLKQAYDTNNLAQVEAILTYLEDGKPFETIHNARATSYEQLSARCLYLQQTIEQMQKEISTLKNTKTYRIMAHYTDTDAYFEALKTQLQTELEYLNEFFNRLSV